MGICKDIQESTCRKTTALETKGTAMFAKQNAGFWVGKAIFIRQLQSIYQLEIKARLLKTVLRSLLL